MVKTTRTWVRSSLDTPWWTTLVTEQYKNYIKEKFVDTGKRISSKLIIDASGLELTAEMVFLNEEALTEFSSDPVFRSWFNTRSEYCKKNGITESQLFVLKDYSL